MIKSNTEIVIGETTNQTKVLVSGREMKCVKSVEICHLDTGGNLVEALITVVFPRFSNANDFNGCDNEEHY